MNGHPTRRARVVIVGGGMGGIAAAKTLANAPVEVTLVDSHNYYLFQPLLYEAAGAIVSTEDVTHAIRGLLRGQANIHFRLATADAVDLEQQQVTLKDGEQLRYEYLILATGLRSDVARVAGAAEHAFAMKTLEDALALRNHLLRRLETAAAHPELVAAGALDIVIVGGSTAGVEVVAAFSEIYNHALRQEFPEIDFDQAKITLVEAGDTLLPMFHPKLRRWVQNVLTQNGTEIRLRSPVAEIGPASVTLESAEELPAGTIIVATGVRATTLADRLGIAQATSGRVVVNRNLSVPGHPEAFAIGDMAALPTGDGTLHPALAQFALQGGRHAAREIIRQIDGATSRPFRYWDKGMTSMAGYTPRSSRAAASGSRAGLPSCSGAHSTPITCPASATASASDSPGSGAGQPDAAPHCCSSRTEARQPSKRTRLTFHIARSTGRTSYAERAEPAMLPPRIRRASDAISLTAAIATGPLSRRIDHCSIAEKGD